MHDWTLMSYVHLPVPAHALTKGSHNTWNFMPLLFSKRECVGSLRTHIEVMTVEGVVWRGLRFIVLIREDLKV